MPFIADDKGNVWEEPLRLLPTTTPTHTKVPARPDESDDLSAERILQGEGPQRCKDAQDFLDKVFNNRQQLLRNNLDRCRYSIARALLFSILGKNRHAAAHAKLALRYIESPYLHWWGREALASWKWDDCLRHTLAMHGIKQSVPDFIVARINSDWTVKRNEDDLEELYLEPRLRGLFKRRENLELAICCSVVQGQKSFLEKGIRALRPLLIKEHATVVGVSASTVSKFIAETSVSTPQGTLPLRSFFARPAKRCGDAALSLPAVRIRVRELIESEKPETPLNERQIAALLESEGFPVTRRTVSKYREELGIASSHVRRRRASGEK